MAKTFGARTPAMEVVKDVDLTGKTAVVTGGNSGIGTETVRALASAGARVLLTSRSVEAGQKVADQLKADGVKGPIEVVQLDLADLASVAKVSAQLAAEPRLDLIVLNAGVMACPQSYTKDGFEMQIGTNHFGHFALTEPLVPKLIAQEFPSRVVALASIGHKFQRGPFVFDDLHYKNRAYTRYGAYGQSKASNILFAKELAARTEGSKVQAFAVHPGVISTNLMRHHINPDGFFGGVQRSFMNALAGWGGTKSIEAGAATSVYAAVSPDLEGKSGAYLADCKVATPSKIVSDPEAAEKLWEVTKEQIEAARAK